MQTFYDLKRYAVLYVDDEEMALKYFERTFGKEFRILTASSAAEGLKIIDAQGDDIGILITDQRMPGEKGVELLQRTLNLRPRLVRMLVTAYADFGVTVDAVNLGSIFRYVSKPIQVEDMRNTLHRAMEFYTVMRERDDLLREKLSVLQNILIIDRVLSLGVLASGIGNQLRNPLQAVQAFLDLAPGRMRPENVDLDRLRSPTFWRDFHDLVAKQVSRIGDLIGGFAADSVAVQKFDPVEAIEEVVEQNRSALSSVGVALSCDYRELPAVHTDAARFRKLIGALLKIDLATEVRTQNAALGAKVGTAQDGVSVIHIQFRNDGAGIPSEALREVFDPFSIRANGTQESGLSLMGVFFLAYHLGGRVIALSPPGQGLNVVLELPVDLKPAAGGDSRTFVTNVLMNDTLWERLLPQ